LILVQHWELFKDHIRFSHQLHIIITGANECNLYHPSHRVHYLGQIQ
jgi:hypothetical protein